MKVYIVLFIILFIGMISCRKDPQINAKYIPTPYELVIPKGFPKPILNINNPLTIEGIKLGRMLYYDSILSSNQLSCSSCHLSNYSFSLPIFTNKIGEKISVPPHVNLAWNPDFNWNGSEPVLDKLCLGDFGPDFFNTKMDELLQKLIKHNQYPELFKKAFQIESIESLSFDELQLKIVYAISQFMKTMISYQSKYDRYLRHEISLTSQEFQGMEIYMTEKGDCFHCHGYPLLTSNLFANNGLDEVIPINQSGRYLVTKNPFDKGKFSIPTLRNIELTAPYMHDGRFNSLEEVVDFYNTGVHLNSENIDPIMTKSFKKHGLDLSLSDKQNLVKFLKTFTDTSFIKNSNYLSPF